MHYREYSNNDYCSNLTRFSIVNCYCKVHHTQTNSRGLLMLTLIALLWFVMHL